MHFLKLPFVLLSPCPGPKKRTKTRCRIGWISNRSELWHNRYLDPLQCDQHHFFDCLRHVPTVSICGIPLAGRARNLARWAHEKIQGLEIHKLEVDLASNASLQDPRISRYEASSYHFHVERGGGKDKEEVANDWLWFVVCHQVWELVHASAMSFNRPSFRLLAKTWFRIA